VWQIDELRGQVLKYGVAIDHREIAQLLRYSSVNFWMTCVRSLGRFLVLGLMWEINERLQFDLECRIYYLDTVQKRTTSLVLSLLCY
jgi:hypothetical protein